MNKDVLTTGEGRTRVNLYTYRMGEELVVCIYNENAHIGAVALGEYDSKEQRASISVITRLGHKDDIVAQKAAHLICKHLKKSICVIAGIHIDNITEQELQHVLENVDNLIGDFLRD